MTYSSDTVKEALRMTANFVGFDDDMKVIHWAAMEWLRERNEENGK